MIAIDSTTKSLLLKNSVHREIIIRFPNAAAGAISEIGSKNIIADSFELKQSICDDGEFTLGGCIAGQMTIQIIGIEQALNNKRINVFIRQTYSKGDLLPADSLYPDDTLLPGAQTATIEKPIFSGTINSSLRQKNRAVKEIVAYDDIYLMSQVKCKTWFLGYVQHTVTKRDTTLRQLVFDTLDQVDLAINRNIPRNILWQFNDGKILNITSALAESVASDNMVVTDILKAYCELNACYAVINPIGQLVTKQLYNQISSSKTDTKLVNEYIRGYSDLEFEEYVTQPINRIRFPENKSGHFDYGFSTDKQSWYVSDNLITKCCTSAQKFVVAFNDNKGNNYIFNQLYSYRPFSAEVLGRWWIEPGDKIQIKTGYNDTEFIESFVFERTIKGINGMKINLKSKGTEFLGKDVIEDELQ